MAHGGNLDNKLHARLRSDVPREAVAWVESALSEEVVDEVALEGGTSSAVHRLTLADGSAVVLRRYVLDWTRDQAWLPANEVRVLTMLEATDLPAPRVLAADPQGSATGVPMLLMSALPGEVIWQPATIDEWLDDLVGLVVAVQAVPLTIELLSWAPYPPEGTPEAWSRDPRAWQHAVERFHGGPPDGETVFTHRDFHPGNVLWVDGCVSGLVDWVSSCQGPPEEDVAHCRINLARSHGQQVADDFLNRWLQATGRSGYDSYFDLVTAVSMASLPDPALDAFVIAAVQN